MAGTIALVGAGEFLEGMAEVDRYLIGRVPDHPARIVILPTAAGMEDVRPWTDMGVPHFKRLGASAEPVFVLNGRDADDPLMAHAVRESNFVYMSGGNPGYLLESLKGSLVWDAIREVYDNGGVIAGCSAGAMVLGTQTRVFRNRQGPTGPSDWALAPGLNLVSPVIVAPHFNRMTGERLDALLDQAPEGLIIVGVDEHTAAVSNGDRWTVMGRGTVALFHGSREPKLYHADEQFELPTS